LGNDLDTQLPETCSHGLGWESCHDETCLEVLTLCGDDPDRRGGYGSMSPEEARAALRKRPVSSYDIAAKEAAEANFRPNDATGEQPRNRCLATVFPNDATVRAAAQRGALNRRETKILTVYLDGESWSAIAERAGCSRRTVKRDFDRIVRRFFDEEVQEALAERRRQGAPATVREDDDGMLYVVRVRGQRRRLWYRRERVAIGTWTDTWLKAEPVRARLRTPAHTPIRSRSWTRGRVGSMNRLIVALVHVLCPAARAPDLAILADPDWARNREWALKRAQQQLGRDGTWPIEDLMHVVRALCRMDQVCRSCHTPLLAGGWLCGQRITRRRSFCDDACKQHFARRAKSMTLSPDAPREHV